MRQEISITGTNPECGSIRHCRLSRGLFQCQECRKQTSPTAGTIFQNTKLPLTVWFQAMHLLTQVKHSVSALELKPWFAKGFAPASTILTDGWKAYNFLDEAGFEHEPYKMSGGWRSSKHPAFPWVNTVLGNLKGNLVGVTRWVGKAHLDRYLAEFQYRFNQRFDLASILPRLLHVAVRIPAMPQPLLKLSYVEKTA
jgi:transposase-like protein